MEFLMAISLALAPGECRTIADFSDPAERARWQVVNDGVMGGLSRGGLSPAGEALRFSGQIVTDGGGFSSIRRDLAPAAIDGASHVRVTMRGDGRQYQLSLRSDQNVSGRRVAYRGDLEPEGAMASVAIEALSPSLFGQALRGPGYDLSSAHSIGVILADGRDGPFELDLMAIEACRE
ncbi:CIA30 family protein [Sphingomicrobium aestuariivivum]|uniref:CIA30 family protein n=1 Tax=Sphingomicrobium aestuariivivum TaxID=1582356 RepID=UPI001FD69AFC|nr:CIA30 family protein [Sphingomicrobium aestuariivivum]MCJ8190849.1 CIA30 family protein [Sphingomicrobium aestuariivivum]